MDIQSVSDVNPDNVSVIQNPDGVYIDSPENISISIHTLSGEKIYQNMICGKVQIPLNTGIYVIKIGKNKPINKNKHLNKELLPF